MKRALLPSKAFIRSAKRLTKRNPACVADLEVVLELLAENAFHPSLRTHKLKGKLAKSWACSAGMTCALFFSWCNTKGKKPCCWKPPEHTTRCIDADAATSLA